MLFVCLGGKWVVLRNMRRSRARFGNRIWAQGEEDEEEEDKDPTI